MKDADPIGAQLTKQEKSAVRPPIDASRVYSEVPVGLCYFDSDLRYAHINQWLAVINGHSVEEHIGRTIGEMLPDVAKGVESQLRRVLETGEPVVDGTVEAETPGQPGAKRLFHHSYLAVKSDEDTIIGVACVVQDITERKRANEQLRSSERRFSLVAESAKDAIILADGTGHISSWNQAAQTIFGYSEEEVLGRPLTTLMPEHYRKPHAKGLERYAQTGKARVIGQTIELEGLRKDGREFPLELSLSTWKTVEGQFYCGIVRDITDRKRTEQKLKQAKDELEERVRLRTESLTKAVSDLKDEMARRKKYEKQARQHLEKLAHFGRIHAMGEMASGLAHELNQPLAAISGQSEICMQFIRRGADASSEDLLKSLVEITKQAQRAGAINHMFRDFARKGEFQRSTVEINELVQQVAKLMEFDTRQHDIVLRLELGNHVPEVLADRIQIEQVLVNLIRNATEAMLESDDGRTLTIQTSFDARGDVMVAVIDSGKGFSADEAARVFDSFYTTKPRGMGLGLAICRSLIEAHSGRIEATANSDRGATFRFTLPVHNNEPTDAT